MGGSVHDWTTFTSDDLTQPVTMLASLPPSDSDVVLLVEPAPEVTTGFLGRRKERGRGVSATLWLANGYGEGDNWHLYLTFPESAPFERLGVKLPTGTNVRRSGKSDAEVILPRGLRPDMMVELAMDACIKLAAEPVPDEWRAQIPDLSHRGLG